MLMPTIYGTTNLPVTQSIFPMTVEYRLHIIKTTNDGSKAKVTIYDGTKMAFEVYGNDLVQALEKARAWIDEQDELVSENDLHVA